MYVVGETSESHSTKPLCTAKSLRCVYMAIELNVLNVNI